MLEHIQVSLIGRKYKLLTGLFHTKVDLIYLIFILYIQLYSSMTYHSLEALWMYVFIRMSWNAIFRHCLYRKYNLGLFDLMSGILCNVNRYVERGRKIGRLRKTPLLYITHKQTSNMHWYKQIIFIENIEANNTGSH